MKNTLNRLLKLLSSIPTSTITKVGDEIRKMAGNLAIMGFAGLAITGDMVTWYEAIFILICALPLYGYGIFLDALEEQ